MIASLLFLVVCCKGEGTSPTKPVIPPQTVVDVRTYGARGDDLADDTDAFKAALRALPFEGGVVYAPQGTYLLQASAGTGIDRAIDLSRLSNITLAGDGLAQTILRMAPGASYRGDTHMILVESASGITIRDLTLDGNRTNVSYEDEQSHGIEVRGSSRLRFERVLFTGMHGDGIRLLGRTGGNDKWVDEVWVEDCQFADNGRSGIAVQRAVKRFQVTRSTFTRISDQAIDMEPTGRSMEGDVGPQDFLITNNHFFDTAKLAITITGISGSDPARGMIVSDNRLDGSAIFVYNAHDVHIERNFIRSAEASQGDRSRPITVEKGSEAVWIVENEIEDRTGEGAVALLFHNSAAPKGVHFLDNIVKVVDNYGFYARDSEQLEIYGNQMTGNGSHSGIFIEDIVPNSPLADFLVEQNQIDGFEVGVQIQSRGDPLGRACVRDNRFDNVKNNVKTEGPVALYCEE